MGLETDRKKLRRRKLVYLASPYSHRLRSVRRRRFEDVCRVAGGLVDDGLIVFCPIAQSHPIAEHSNVEAIDWDVWMDVDLTILARCTHLYVVMMDGWKESRGVTAEISFAKEHNIPITYLTTDGVILNVKN